MAPARKVIITCAVTGSIHTPSMSEYLPITPDQIAETAIGAAEAGAAILHLHARQPHDGLPTQNPEVYKQFLPKIKAATNAVINITTGGGQIMTVEQRIAGPASLKPEMCSLNMGSMNFALFPILAKPIKWKYDWEPGYLENSRGHIFKNTFSDIECILKTIGEGCGTKFEYECYDVGHLYNLAHFVDRGLVKPPFFVQTIFGILGGIGPDIENLHHMRMMADKLFGNDYLWSILAAGKYQMNFVTSGAIMGSNVRVGLEDSLYLGKGEFAKSNADQVRKIRGILESLSFDIAKPDDVRQMLQLKGKENVGF